MVDRPSSDANQKLTKNYDGENQYIHWRALFDYLLGLVENMHTHTYTLVQRYCV